MEHILGVGGYFIRSTDPEALRTWYRDVLGVPMDGNGQWQASSGPTVLATFARDTDYLGAATQQTMINFRVRDLGAVLEQVRAAGGQVDDDTFAMEGVGTFGWVTDPEGNRIELWQPAP